VQYSVNKILQGCPETGRSRFCRDVHYILLMSAYFLDYHL
jgi:hypothetical protein